LAKIFQGSHMLTQQCTPLLMLSLRWWFKISLATQIRSDPFYSHVNIQENLRLANRCACKQRHSCGISLLKRPSLIGWPWGQIFWLLWWFLHDNIEMAVIRYHQNCKYALHWRTYTLQIHHLILRS